MTTNRSSSLAVWLVLATPFAAAAAADDGGSSPVDGGIADGAVIPDGGPSVDLTPAPPPVLVPPVEVPPPARPAPTVRRGLVAPPVDVRGRAPRALDHIPGTTAVLRHEDLKQIAPQSGADALRTVPGLNVVAEDGMGLRLNVGIRGLDPNRSRKVLVLEDGMPVTLNPYGSPEMYYTPPIERMDRVDVIKGSGQILWGPQTIGGVINYVTRDPPRKLGVFVDVRHGSYDYLLAQGGIGSTIGPVGWRVDVIHRRFDGTRRLDLALTDVSGKLRVQLAPSSTLTLKLNYYEELSRATYLGLTTPQWLTDPSLSLAANDHFVVRRYSLGLTHQHVVGEQLLLQTLLYAYHTSRDWRRQEYDREDLGHEYERICDGMGRCGPRGDASIAARNDGSSVFFRRTTENRNRDYSVAGVESRLTWTWKPRRAPALVGELTAVARLHYERAHDYVNIGLYPTDPTGDTRTDERRNGYALALALQNRFVLWNRLRIIPALRFEGFWSERHVVREPLTLPDGTVGGMDANGRGSAFSFAFIPGLGVSLDVAGPFSLYGGFHRGYAPPRTRDAVSSGGQNLQLDPELSWNFELGGRLRLGRWLIVDAASFLIEFQNQIIPPSDAGGATGASFSTGQSRHAGLEASVTFNLASLAKWTSFTLPLTVNYTYLPVAHFLGGLREGYRLPYAPEHLLWAQLRFAHRLGPSVQLSATYVSDQFADKDNTIVPTPDGLIGVVPGYFLVDARIAYTYARYGVTFYVVGKNLTDQKYISSRTPAGVQPAGFRQIFGGVEWAW